MPLSCGIIYITTNNFTPNKGVYLTKELAILFQNC